MKNNLYIALAIFLLITFLSRTSFSQGISCRTGLEVRDCDQWEKVPCINRFGEDEICCGLVQTDIEKNCTNQTVDGVVKCGYYYDSTFSCRQTANRQDVIIDNCNITGSTFYTCAAAATPTPRPPTSVPPTSVPPTSVPLTSAPPTSTPIPVPTCKPDGASCSGGGGNCCSGICTSGSCGAAPTSPPACKLDGEACTGGGGRCCSLVCTNFRCGLPPTSTPTPIPAEPWYKLKDSSLVGISSINNPIPASPLTAYDADDSTNRVLIGGSNPGVVSGQSITIGGASVSSNNWSISGKTYSEQTTITKFIDYVNSKKTALIDQGKINIYTGDKTLSDSDITKDQVIIVEGNITLSGTTFNSLNNYKLVIMATGKITFPTGMSAANGLFIADSLDFGTTANQGIKIIGNIIAQSSFSNAREWSDWKKPGLFLVFDPSHYIGMLDMLSTITYDWRQIQ